MKPFKQNVKDNQAGLLMTCPIDITKSQMEVALGNGTYDAVYFDGQHRPISEQEIVSFCAIAEELGMAAQMRLPHTRQAHFAGRFCDFGLSSIMVPEVMTEETVNDAVEFFWYGPIGRRSWGGPNRVGLGASGGNPERLEYAEWWNDHAVLVLQFESLEAVAHARRFADRPGVDYVAFGPNDMRFNIERHTDPPLSTVEACFQNVADQLDPVGIPRCLAVAVPKEERDKWQGVGVTIFWEEAKF